MRSGTTWIQEAYLKASNAGADDRFGRSVAVSGDTVVVGAWQEDGDIYSTAAAPNNNANRAGAAYVFVRSGTTWSQEAYLKASNAGAGDNFGYSVAISGDTVVVGAYYEAGDANSTAATPNENASNAGAAYIFGSISAANAAFASFASSAGLTGANARPDAIPFNDGV